MFKHTVTSEKELRDLMGTPSERAIKKESPFIDQPSRDFIAHAPFLLLATSDAKGRCDVSPKGPATSGSMDCATSSTIRTSG